MNATRPNTADSSVSQPLQHTINHLDDGEGVTIGTLLMYLSSEGGVLIEDTLARLERLEDAGEIYNATGDEDDPRYRVTKPEELEDPNENEDGEELSFIEHAEQVHETRDDTYVAPGTIETCTSVVENLTEARGRPVSTTETLDYLPWDEQTIENALEAAEGVESRVESDGAKRHTIGSFDGGEDL